MPTDEITEEENFIHSSIVYIDSPHRIKSHSDGRLKTTKRRRKNQRSLQRIRQIQKVQNCTLDNKAKLYAPIIDRQEENRGLVIKCFNWLDHSKTTIDHLETLLFFFLKMVIVVGGCTSIIYFYFFVKKLFV